MIKCLIPNNHSYNSKYIEKVFSKGTYTSNDSFTEIFY